MTVTTTPTPSPHLIDPLTVAEEKVLNLLAQGLSDKEIGLELSIAPITVRGDHKQNIYDKLGLQPSFRNRKWAVHCARQLGLLPSFEDAPNLEPPGDNPYKGLDAFQPDDAHLFFGREAFIDQLTTRLSQNGSRPRFLAIVGPSGCGKSSIVRAGLVPALKQDRIPGASTWAITTMFPRINPFYELEMALRAVAVKPQPDLLELLQRDSFGLARAARLILPENRPLLLVIDQFEEVFTLVEDPTLARRFMDLLYAAVTDPRSMVRVIITLRADFLDRPLMYPDFSWLVQEHTAMVVPLNPDELERAITLPAQQAHVTLEPGLVAELVAKANEQPGALPLLEFTLTELYDNRVGRTVTLNTYEEIGGLNQALAAQADTVYAGLNTVQQEATRQLFLRLISLGEGTEDVRRRVPIQELVALDAPSQSMEYVTQFLAANRLLTLDLDPATKEPTVEVAHEALIREWGRLREWLEDSRNDVRMQRLLATAVDDWQRHDREKSYLMRGAKLAQYEGWRETTDLALTTDENQFLEISIVERDREHRRRQTVLYLALGFSLLVAVVMAVMAGWAVAQRNWAENSEYTTLVQASIGLAAQAELELVKVEGLSERATLLALEALEEYPYTWQAERALFAAVQHTWLIHMLRGHTDMVYYSAWSPDGSRLLTASYDGTTRVWNAESGAMSVLDEHSAEVEMGAWSPDGTMVATTCLDGTVKIFDMNTSEALHILTGHSAEVWWAAWSPDGTRIATASYDGTARVWEIATGEQLLVLTEHAAAVSDVAWSPDGEKIATTSIDETARVWNATTGETLLVLQGHTNIVRQVSWSPDGSQIATAGHDATIRIWDATSGQEIFVLSREGYNKAWLALWSPDGSQLLTVQSGFLGEPGVATLWDTTTGELVFSLPGLGTAMNFGAWSPDGTRVAVCDSELITRVWDVATGEELFVLHHPRSALGALGAPRWSPDGDRLATTDDKGTLYVWDVTGSEKLKFQNQDEQVLAWAPDGRSFARADREGPLYITDRETGEPVLTLPWVGTPYNGARWSPDGTVIATLHEDGSVRIWDAVLGNERLQFDVGLEIYIPHWSPDSTQLSVTTLWDGLAYIYDATTGDRLMTFDAGEPRSDLVWSPDGTQIVGTIAEAGQVKIWAAATGNEIRTIPIGDYFVLSVDWSPDGERLVVSTSDGVHIVDPQTGDILLTYTGHNAWVILADWSPAGNRIVTVSDDSVRIWDPVTGTEYGALDVNASMALWSPDGTRLLTLASSDNVVRMWQVFPDTASLMDYAKACCVFREFTPEERVLFGLPMHEE